MTYTIDNAIRDLSKVPLYKAKSEVRRILNKSRKATLDEVREKVNKEEICKQCADRIDWGIELLLAALETNNKGDV